MEHEASGILIFWNIIAFILTILVVRYAVWSKLMFFLEERKKSMESLHISYEQKNKELNDLNERLKEESIKAAQRRNKLLLDTQKQTAEITKNALSKANKEAENLIIKARYEIVKERNKAFEEVKADVSLLINKSIKIILYDILDEELDNKVMNEVQKVVTSVEY
jgi:F-type H+-transporting ATPase subunit b